MSSARVECVSSSIEVVVEEEKGNLDSVELVHLTQITDLVSHL